MALTLGEAIIGPLGMGRAWKTRAIAGFSLVGLPLTHWKRLKFIFHLRKFNHKRLKPFKLPFISFVRAYRPRKAFLRRARALTVARLLLHVRLETRLALAAARRQRPLAVALAQVGGSAPNHLGVADARARSLLDDDDLLTGGGGGESGEIHSDFRADDVVDLEKMFLTIDNT